MINYGTVLLNITLLISILSIILLLYLEYSGKKEISKIATWTIRISTILSMSTFLLLMYYFLCSDFRFTYVTQYSSTLLSTFYKLAATIAVQDGALLLWSALIFLQALWLSEKYGLDSRFFRRMQIIILFTGALLTFVVAYKSSMYPFQTWYDIWGGQYSFITEDYAFTQGAGLRPVLKDPIMAIHPPTQFIAYATAIIPFAAALSYLLTPGVGKIWEQVQRQWIRICWFFMSVTLVLGGAWIYKLAQWGTLSGTGNIWAWDPYETTPFIVWLLITLFMHMAYKYRTSNQYVHLTPLFGTLTFISSLYAGWVARSGAISSTHDVGKLPSSDIFFWVTAVLLAGVFILVFLKIKNIQDEEGVAKPLLSESHLFNLSAIIFIILTFIAFFGISAPIFSNIMLDQNANPTDREFFNTLAYPFTMVLLILMGVCLGYKPIVKRIGIQKFLIAPALVLLLCIILAFYSPGPEFDVINHSSPFYKSASDLTRGLGSLSLLSFIPVFIFSIAITIYKFIIDVDNIKDKNKLIKPIGIFLIHSGTIILLLGVIVSQSFDLTYRFTYPDSNHGDIIYLNTGLLDDFGTSKHISNPIGFQLVPDGTSLVHTRSTTDQTVEGQTKNAFYVNLYRDNKLISSGTVCYWMELYDENLDGSLDKVEWTDIMDDEKLYKSYHVKFAGSSDGGYNFVVKEIPLISFVWIGSGMMCFGVLLVTAHQYLFAVRTNGRIARRQKKVYIEGKKSKHTDKYENMLIDELNRIKIIPISIDVHRTSDNS
jgi:cytochrome c-type biogenesis protein CcmF